jgi:hypothetical protein
MQLSEREFLLAKAGQAEERAAAAKAAQERSLWLDLAKQYKRYAAERAEANKRSSGAG